MGIGDLSALMFAHPLVACRRRWICAVWLVAGSAALGQTNPPAVPLAIDAATYQRLVDENVDLRREQTRLTRDANDLRRRNASLLLQVQELERKQDALATALSGMQSPDELRADLDRTRQARDTLSREVERTRAEARSTNSVSVHAAATVPAPSPDSDLYRKLERENVDLRAQLSKAIDSSQSASQARDAVGRRETQLKAQVDELNAELATRRHESEQTAAREKAFKAAIVKIARKAAAYEAALREATAKTVVVATVAPPTNAVASTAAARPRKTEPSALDAVRKAIAAGRYRDAERLCRDGLDRDPTNALFHYNLGVLYDDYLGDPRAAALHYRKYLDMSPGAPDASIVRSWLLELDVKAR